MNTAYFDCFSGVSGDMILGALIDAGLSPERLQTLPERLGLANTCRVTSSRVRRKAMAGVRVQVEADEPQPPHRGLDEMTAILAEADISNAVRQQSLRLFQRLAEVEAAIHDTDIAAVHFHELGGLDTLVDVVGALDGLEALDVTRAYASPIVLGQGTVRTRHGRLPVPAPATLALLQDFAVRFGGADAELATPTGAALLWAVATPGPPPHALEVQTVGYGAGARDLEMPNLLRLVVAAERPGLRQTAGLWEDDFAADQVAVLETQVDDTNPQLLGSLYPRLLDAGALDLTVTPVQMKKGRPGFLLTLLVPPETVPRFTRMLMQETTTLGVRVRVERRLKARRQLCDVETPYGTVRIKVGWVGDEAVHVVPEFDDCLAIAAEQDLPVRKVLEAAETAGRDQLL